MYESGVFVALLIWMYGVISSIITINSRMERNLNKVGQRRSWIDGSIKMMTKADVERSLFASAFKFFIVWAISFFFIVFSWLQVALVAAILVYRWNKDSGAPQSIREFRWKLKNSDLSFQQVVTEMYKVGEMTSPTLEEFITDTAKELRSRGIPTW